MKYRVKVKFTSRFLLVIEIIVAILTSLYFFYEQYTETLLWFAVVFFLIIVPQYTIIPLIDKCCDKINENIDSISEVIREFDKDKLDKIKKIGGFESICESVEFSQNKIKFLEKNDEMLREILTISAKNLELEKFLDEALPKILEITNSNCIVFYLVNNATNKLEIKASLGFSKSIYSQFDISLGEGIIGQAVSKNKIQLIEDIPDDSIFIAKTFVGKIKPKNLLAVPVVNTNDTNEVIGIIAVTSIYKYNSLEIENMERIRDYLSYAVINGNYYNKNKRLNNELRFQNQLIQNLNEDLESKIKERTLFLNNIINSIQDIAIISVDMANNIIMFNTGAERLLKIEQNEAIGKNIKIIADGTDSIEKNIIRSINEAIYKGRISEMHDITRKDGSFYSINVEIFALYNEVGENNGVTIVIKEVNNKQV